MQDRRPFPKAVEVCVFSITLSARPILDRELAHSAVAASSTASPSICLSLVSTQTGFAVCFDSDDHLWREKRGHGMSCELQHSGLLERISQHQRTFSWMALCKDG